MSKTKSITNDLPKEDLPPPSDIPAKLDDAPQVDIPKEDIVPERQLRKSGPAPAPVGASLMASFLDAPPKNNNNNNNAPPPPPLPTAEPKKRGRPPKAVTTAATDPFDLLSPKEKEAKINQLNKSFGVGGYTKDAPTLVPHKEEPVTITDAMIQQGRLIERINMYRKLHVGEWLGKREFKAGKEDVKELAGIEARLQEELRFKDTPDFLMEALDVLFQTAHYASLAIPIIGLHGMHEFMADSPDAPNSNPFRQKLHDICIELSLKYDLKMGPEQRLILTLASVMFYVRQMNMQTYRQPQAGDERLKQPVDTSAYDDL